jgi:hypothetical protein
MHGKAEEGRQEMTDLDRRTAKGVLAAISLTDKQRNSLGLAAILFAETCEEYVQKALLVGDTFLAYHSAQSVVRAARATSALWPTAAAYPFDEEEASL